jgi:hypothetical protein
MTSAFYYCFFFVNLTKIRRSAKLKSIVAITANSIVHIFQIVSVTFVMAKRVKIHPRRKYNAAMNNGEFLILKILR